MSSFVGGSHVPPAGYVLASALTAGLPLPVRSAWLECLRQFEPSPREVREAREALTVSGFLLPGGGLTAEGQKVVRKALELLG